MYETSKCKCIFGGVSTQSLQGKKWALRIHEKALDNDIGLIEDNILHAITAEYKCHF